MPGGDRTGPRGFGPMTGRGAGYCAGYAVQGSGNVGMRAGFLYRGGGGGGRGWRNWYYATGLTGWQRAGGWQGPLTGGYGPAVSREQQLEALKNQAEYMRATLDDITKQIEDIESQGRKDSK